MAKRGRPRLSPDEPSTRLTLSLPESLYDRTYAAAAQARLTIPEVIRRMLFRELRQHKIDNPASHI